MNSKGNLVPLLKHMLIILLALLLCMPVIAPTAQGAEPDAPVQAAAAANSVMVDRFLTLYNQIKNPANGYFSPEGIPYHAVETLMSEAPDYGHMTTSEAYSYWLWLETLYGYYTGDWSKLEDAWDNMETFIIPSASEQPTMSHYRPGSPADYFPERPYPDMYPTQPGQIPVGQDPLDAELKATYGNNDTYLMHWLLDVDDWYGFGNTLNPNHTATYVNTFQRGEQESVWEAITHPSQDDFTYGKPGEGYVSLFVGGNPAPQWRYTAATDADARAVQVMYWAKELGYNNQTYLNKAKKMGDYLRYGMYDKYFVEIGSTANGNARAGSGKSSSHYLMAWYTAWGGGLGTPQNPHGGNWAWRIGSSHVHQAYNNPVAAYALSRGGLEPSSATGASDWDISMTRQLEFYTWLLSDEGAVGGGATNSIGGSYDRYPAGVSTFYGLAYDEDPVYHDPPSNNWFGFQAWPLERVAEFYYILAANGDTSSKEFQMAKLVMDKWIDWSMDYTFVHERPVTDDDGYYLDPNGQRILGGHNPTVATVSEPGAFYIIGNQEWSGQPDSWNGFDNFTGNPNFHAAALNPSQDVGVLGSYIKALTFYAAATKAENGDYSAQGAQARDLANSLLDVAWNYNDGIGIAVPEPRGDYFRFFEKEIYFPAGWTGTTGQGNTISSSLGVPSDPARGGNGYYISYADLRPDIKQDPQWEYLENLYQTSYNPSTGEWENGVPTFTYHRFWSQVDMATAYAEFDRLIGDDAGPSVPVPPGGVQAVRDDGQATISWNSVSNADSYNVKRATTSGGPYTNVATGLNGTSFTNTGLTNGVTYYYVVTAVNSEGESAHSTEVSVTPAPPQLPGEFTLTAVAGNGQVSLEWTASTDATGYAVQRATSASGPFSSLAAVAGRSYVDTSAINGTTYYYRIAASNSVGTTLSNTASATPQVPLPGTFTLSATAGNGQVALNWSASSNAQSYSVERATAAAGPFSELELTTGRSYTDTSVVNGTTYYYRVRAQNTSGDTLSNTVSATPIAVDPGGLRVEYKTGDTNASDNQMKPHFRIVNGGTAPVSLSELEIRYWFTNDQNQTMQVNCDWSQIGCSNIQASVASMAAPAENADSYLSLSFASGAGQLAAGANTGDIQLRLNSSNWANLNETNDYSYDGTMTAYGNNTKVGLYRNGTLIAGSAPGDSGQQPQPPAAPNGLTAAAGDGAVTLSWHASSGATHYTVKRATTSGGPYAAVASEVSGTSYTDSGLTNGTTYYYVVSASNSAGESLNSTAASATPQGIVEPQPPAAPNGLTAAAGDGAVTLSWNASSGATHYTVKRATTSGGPYAAVASEVSGTSYTDSGLTNGTTYYYVVSASNNAGESPNSAPASATPQGVTAPSGLAVLYKAGDTSATDNQIKPHFNIVNRGTSAVPLSELKLRYYFTKDGSESVSAWIDWAQIGQSNIATSFTDSYVELSFTAAAGSIAPGSQTGEIQLRLAKSNWSNFNETNDYSYDGTKTSFAEWDRVTLYRNGTLVWGIEP
ncbi:glycoside hydrolase family 48 protein [Xylanibacillus composti]|nr:glycoside hydrolase family 48 protein [Xylanibacillus composti]